MLMFLVLILLYTKINKETYTYQIMRLLVFRIDIKYTLHFFLINQEPRGVSAFGPNNLLYPEPTDANIDDMV